MAANPNDLLDFYNADLGVTRALALTTASAITPDSGGALPQGRYLLQIVPSSDTSIGWITMVPFVAGETPTVAAAAPAFPFAQVRALEVNVRPNHNDRIVGIMATGTATLYITQISRLAKKGV